MLADRMRMAASGKKKVERLDVYYGADSPYTFTVNSRSHVSNTTASLSRTADRNFVRATGLASSPVNINAKTEGIDVTSYSKMVVEIEMIRTGSFVGGNCSIGMYDESTVIRASYQTTGTIGRSFREVDISHLTGTHYPFIGVNLGTPGDATTREANVFKIWLE